MEFFAIMLCIACTLLVWSVFHPAAPVMIAIGILIFCAAGVGVSLIGPWWE